MYKVNLMIYILYRSVMLSNHVHTPGTNICVNLSALDVLHNKVNKLLSVETSSAYKKELCFSSKLKTCTVHPKQSTPSKLNVLHKLQQILTISFLINVKMASFIDFTFFL